MYYLYSCHSHSIILPPFIEPNDLIVNCQITPIDKPNLTQIDSSFYLNL